jgi:glycosyltransferase involved in cell wall biosynthesis
MHIAYLNYLMRDDTAFHHVRQFTAAAQRLGHDVEIAAMNFAESGEEDGGGPPGPLSWARTREVLKQKLGRYLHEPKEVVWNLLYVRAERALLSRLSPDVLLVRDHSLTASCVPVSRQLGLPLVLEVNSPAQESRLYMDEYAHLPLVPERLERWKLQNAHRVTVVSSALKGFLMDSHGIESDKIIVNPNGADTAMFHTALSPDAEISQRLPGRTVIGFVGSFQKWHGSAILGAMVNRVARCRPDAAFLMVGDGPERAPVEAATREVGDRVLFLGRVPHDRIPDLVGSLDVGVMPESNFYGSPLKVIEWMASGVPVVAPRYGPLEEVIDDGVDGLLFTPGDVDHLTSQIERLIDSPELRERIGAAAAKRVTDGLTWEHNAQRVLDACEQARTIKR